MLNVFYILFFMLLLVMANSSANAKDGCQGECVSCHNLSIKEAEELLKKTGGMVTSIKQAPISGMFELLMEKDGRQGVIYVDYAKKNFMQGFIVNFETLKKVSAHDKEIPRPRLVTHTDPGTIPVENAIVMGNPYGLKKIYVFSDPDCPYCREQHVELKKLEKMDAEITINILLYPLPAHVEAFDKSRAILTFKNRSVLDKAFGGAMLPAVGTKDGTKELNEIINYARRSGITVTPTIVLSDGTVLSGFKSAVELKNILSGTKQN